MSPDRWNRIKEILDISLRVDPRERTKYLDRVCGGDTDLRAEVESLLEAHEDAGDLFESPPLPETADPLIGARLGQYQIVEEIGSGGMGSVYRAVRADEVFQKEVAVKVVRRGLDLGNVIRQFRRERQIMASLEHPNIATLLDGGGTPDGLPYFVMEYIPGRPIDRYCEEQGLSTGDRLRLFRAICGAVAFAHRRNVVHRDIKPGNILVTGEGIPKLLDFGIAKIVKGDLPAGREAVTTIGGAMTPEYASPEQLTGGAITPASDVYSLGVLLHELLSGKRPARPKTGPLGIGEEAERILPSRLSGRRELAGDLDNIVLMAIREEPERRYASAAELEDDIRRHLEKLPVLARGDSRIYRASRIVRRHKLAAVSSAAAVAGCMGLLILLTVRDRLADGGTPPQITPVTSLAGSESQPSFSPDGKKIVYVWSGENGDNPDIYVQSLDGGPPRRLTTDPADDFSPVWSRDGSRIAWLRVGEQETAVFASPLEGGNHGKIADLFPSRVEAVGRHLDWSPDGEYLAAADKSLPEQPFHLALIRARDGSKRELALPPENIIGDMSPAFSPDGKSVAFIRAVSSGVNDIYVVPVSGGPARRITFDNRYLIGLTWTPDGRSIVFSSERRGNPALWVVPTSGGTPARVAVVGDNVSDPAFSRDGRRLLYAQSFTDSNIWHIDSLGRGKPKKLIASSQIDTSPQYSPDGTRVAFRSNRSGSHEIWMSGADGTGAVQLTHFGGPLAGTPRWSPDGKSIAFDARPDGAPDIYVVPAAGGALRRITTDPLEDVVPSWSNDGRWIYFASRRTGAWQVWRTPAQGGPDEQVTRLGGFAAFESPDGKYLYYAKSRAGNGLWRKLLPDGEEVAVLDQLQAGFWGYWAIAADGIYFVDQPRAYAPASIELFHLRDRAQSRVFTLEKRPVTADSAFALSPDGKDLLYVQIDQSGSDVMMLDHYNWRQ